MSEHQDAQDGASERTPESATGQPAEPTSAEPLSAEPTSAGLAPAEPAPAGSAPVETAAEQTVAAPTEAAEATAVEATAPASGIQPTAPAAPAAPAAQAAPAAPGAPVEESAVTATDVLAAVDRAGELGAEPATSGLGPADDHAAPAAAEPVGHRPPIAVPDEMPSAGPIPDAVALPATPAAPAPADDRVLVSASHPMAALYMQTPMPPDMRGNRGAGVLISVLATLVFALLFGAVLLFWAGGPAQPVPVLMQTGLWPLAAAAAAFFVGMALLVLIVGRAGWWAYVLGGFFVGVLVWLATIAGVTYSVILISGTTGLTQIVTGGAPGAGVTVLGLIAFYGLQIPAIAAGVIAREVTVWFGAWIGARGRRMSRSNAEALAEYEASLAEAQAKQLP